MKLLNNISKGLALVLCLLFSISAMAQGEAPSWLVDELYGSGKYNTVVAVVAVILIGIGLWLFAMDRKLRKLEEKADRSAGEAR